MKTKAKIFKVEKEKIPYFLNKLKGTSKDSNREDNSKCTIFYKNSNNIVSNFTTEISNPDLSTIKDYIYMIKTEDGNFWLPNHVLISNIDQIINSSKDTVTKPLIIATPEQCRKVFDYNVSLISANGLLDLKKDIKPFTRKPDRHTTVEFDYFIEWFEKRINRDNLELNPDFQRGHVWSEHQQIKFVEFILRGGRTTEILLNKNENTYVVVDGLQRITAITKFLNNEFEVFGGYTASQINHAQLMYGNEVDVYTHNLKTRKEILQWYVEINSGGTPHTDEEIERVKNLIEKEN